MEESEKKINENEKKIIIFDPMKVHPLHAVAFIETFVFVLCVGFFLGKNIFSTKKEYKNTITYLTEKIAEISELSTLQYDYDAIERIESAKAKWYGINIPGTDDIVEIKISGTIKFGINLRDVRIRANEDAKGNIVIKIPKAQIVSHELDYSTAKVMSVKNNVLNNLQQSFSDVMIIATEAFGKLKEEKEKSSKVQECYEKATENAKSELELLLKPLVPKDKSIQFDFI